MQEAGGEQTFDILRRHGAVAHAPAGSFDFNQGFKPEHAPAASPNHLHVIAAHEDGIGDLIGPNGAGGRITRDEYPHRHPRIPSSNESARAAVIRP